MNQTPYGYPAGYQQQVGYQQPYPPPPAAPPPVASEPPDPAPGLEDLKTATMWLAGGLMATFATIALVAYKNENDHDAIKSYVDDYIAEHSFRHQQLNDRLGALEHHSSVAETVYQEPMFVPQEAYLPSLQATLPGIGRSSLLPTLRRPMLPATSLMPTLIQSDAPTRVMSGAGTRMARTRRAASVR